MFKSALLVLELLVVEIRQEGMCWAYEFLILVQHFRAF